MPNQYYVAQAFLVVTVSGDSGVLYQSVQKQIFSLPPETLLYPAHDYTGTCAERTVSFQKRPPFTALFTKPLTEPFWLCLLQLLWNRKKSLKPWVGKRSLESVPAVSGQAAAWWIVLLTSYMVFYVPPQRQRCSDPFTPMESKKFLWCLSYFLRPHSPPISSGMNEPLSFVVYSHPCAHLNDFYSHVNVLHVLLCKLLLFSIIRAIISRFIHTVWKPWWFRMRKQK